jgi:hypothetical protein
MWFSEKPRDLLTTHAARPHDIFKLSRGAGPRTRPGDDYRTSSPTTPLSFAAKGQTSDVFSRQLGILLTARQLLFCCRRL